MAIGGSVTAAAVVIGKGWAAAAPVEAVTIAAAIGYYVLGGRGGDLGAITGHRADERQESIRVRARALAAQVAGLAAAARYVIELARGSAVWPSELFVAVLAGSFPAGLVIYRAGGAGPADGPEGKHEERSRLVSRSEPRSRPSCTTAPDRGSAAGLLDSN
jgi:hypothetical protein